MIVVDGSQGEGGGQILRTSLALSLVTGAPFRIENVRAGRKKPGLMRQHLTAVRAAAEVGRARVEGDELASRQLTFRPEGVTPGTYRFAVGTAGSATLILQTVLPALLTAPGPTTLTLEGGTHNPWAPPFDFLARSFLPLVSRMGPDVQVALEQWGFYPAGGGRFQVTVRPADRLRRIDLLERGEVLRRRARAVISGLPGHIAERELRVIRAKLDFTDEELVIQEVAESRGPGNVLLVEVESQHVTEVFTGFGERGVRAEAVAERTAKEARRYLAAGVAVGPHLADQLLVPMALAGGGSFRTVAPTRHTQTNADVLARFLDVAVAMEEEASNVWRVDVTAGDGAAG